LVAVLLAWNSPAASPTLDALETFGGAASTQVTAVDVDISGNRYDTGIFEETVDFDPGAGTTALTAAVSATDVWVRKFSNTGNLAWAVQLAGAGYVESYGMAVDGSGSVFVVGYFDGTVDFDPGAGTFNLTAPATSYDAFVLKLNSSGIFQWAASISTTGENYAYDVAVDSNGDVITVGEFDGTADFDPGAGTDNIDAGGSGFNFIWKLDSTGAYVWTKTVDWIVTSVATDSSDNVLMAGSFNGTVDFNPDAGENNLSALGTEDAALVKYNSSGAYVWAKNAGGTSATANGNFVGVDAFDNVYGIGIFQDAAVDFDPGAGTSSLSSVSGSRDVFVQALDSSGVFRWAKSVGGMSFDTPKDADVSRSGNVYVTGTFLTTVDLDPGAGTDERTAVGSTDIFAFNLNPNGELVWAYTPGGSGVDSGEAIVALDASTAFIGGTFTGPADFDPAMVLGPAGSLGVTESFVVQVTTDERTQPDLDLLRSTGNFGGTAVSVIKTDASGNIYTAGSFNNTIDLDPGPGMDSYTTTGTLNGYFQKLDPNGDYDMGGIFGSTEASGNTSAFDLALDSTGNIYMTGFFSGEADFDPGAGTFVLDTGSVSQWDVFVLKLDSSGAFQWAVQAGGTGNDVGEGIDVDVSGNVYVAGYFNGTADFDPSGATANETSAGMADAFLWKLDASGNLVWVRTIGDSGPERGVALALDSSGNPTMAMSFEGTVDFDPGVGVESVTSSDGDSAIVKLDGAGVFQWVAVVTGAGQDEVRDLALDSSDNVYSLGDFESDIDLDPGAGTVTENSAAAQDGYIQIIEFVVAVA